MEALTLESCRSAWQRVEPFVALATAGDVLMYDAISAAVESGSAAAYVLISPYDGRDVAGFVTTVTAEGYAEVSAAGAVPGFDLVNRVMPEIERCAREAGAKGIQVPTYRRGMVELLARQGWATVYVMMAKKFNV